MKEVQSQNIRSGTSEDSSPDPLQEGDRELKTVLNDASELAMEASEPGVCLRSVVLDGFEGSRDRQPLQVVVQNAGVNVHVSLGQC